MAQGFYGRDLIEITPVTKDVGTGEEIKGTPYEVHAFVEDLSSTRKIVAYREPDSYLFIIIWGEDPIKMGDYVTVLEQFGQTIPEEDRKPRVVQQASKMGWLTQSSVEVFA